MPHPGGEHHDVLIIGGGPSGSTAARELAHRGLDVLILDQDTFPRFRIGESFLPRNLQLIRELGLEDELRALPQVPKPGAEFLMGHGRDPSCYAWFHNALGAGGGEGVAFNLERAPFDAMLAREAERAGAGIRQKTRVRRITRLEDGAVTVVATDRDGGEQEIHGRILLDASGQGTVVARHLGTRRVLPDLRKVSYYGHYRGVRRGSGETAGMLTVVMCREGWFFLIPLDEETTSVGLVMEEQAFREAGIPAREMLSWALRRCPVMAQRCENAEPLQTTGVAADFSYTCRPYAGPGYFLIGDAATFVDPIFSTGVCLGMMAARDAAKRTAKILLGSADPRPLRRSYIRYAEGSSKVFFRLVRAFYTPEFRDLFLNEEGPLSVHRAVLGVLAGNVFPRPPFPIRWRLHLFELFMALQRRVALVPRRETFSLLTGRIETV